LGDRSQELELNTILLRYVQGKERNEL